MRRRYNDGRLLKQRKKKLLEVCRRRNTSNAEIRQLINAGANVNITDDEGKTALFYAAKYSHSEGIIQELVDAGADVNATDDEGKTALFYAVQQRNNDSVVRALIDAGADVNITDDEGKTALFYAVQYPENESVVPKLVDGGVDVNITDNEGKTALFYAVQYPDNESVILPLVDGGANVNITDDEQKTALFYAFYNLYSERVILKFIDSGADVHLTDNMGKTALFYAVQYPHNESVILKLIDAGVDVNKIDNEGKTALFYAVRYSCKESVILKLIDASADVNITDDEGKTALFYAFYNHYSESVILKLVDAGADVKKTDNEGKTALFYAVHYRYGKSVIPKLIDDGADVNITDNMGKTALFYAVQYPYNESVILKLIDASADVNITDNEGKTALFYAFYNHYSERVILKLVDAGVDVKKTDNEGKTALFYAVQYPYSENVITKLIGASADVNITDNEGKTALFYAVRYSCKESVISKLIDAGADVNITDNEGKTALFYAFYNYYGERVIKKLIDAGADVNKTDNEGKTALIYAVQISYKESVIPKMIDAGADVNIIDNEGKTALVYAVQHNNIESIVSALIDADADVNITDNEGKTALFYIVSALIDTGPDVNIADNEGKTVLFYVVQQSYDESIVSALIGAGADVNIIDHKGKTVLFYAVQHNNNESIISALIGARADVNITDNEGKTTLFYAVQHNNIESIVSALVDAGADINITDNEGKTALFHIVSALIDAGADVNITDNEGKTVLFYAIQLSCSDRVVYKIIDAGALLNVTDHYGRTPLFYAITQSISLGMDLLERGALMYFEANYSVLTFLIEKLYKAPDDLRESLQILVKQKIVTKNQTFEAIINVAFYKILSFEERSDVVFFFSGLLNLAKDYIPLFDAWRKGHLVKRILNKINERETKSVTKQELISNILHQLVSLGANPNSTDSDGNTALHHAVQLPSYGVPKDTVLYICNQLKEMGASCSMKNHKNETPLLRCVVSTIMTHQCCKEWTSIPTQLALCQFLIEHGSDVEVKVESGKSILHLILELLRHVLEERESKITWLDELIEILQKTLIAHNAKGSPEVIKDDSGNTPLHVWATMQLPPGQDYSSAIVNGWAFRKVLKMILDHFRDDNTHQLNVKNENGETPLHLCRTWTAVELLLDAGASPNDVDSSGRSPLLFAAKNSKTCASLYPDILLVQSKFWRKARDKGLDPWTVDFHGESVLSVLMESKSHDLARALVDFACAEDSKVQSQPVILFSLLAAICKDKLPKLQWKKDAAEMILNSSNCPVNGNDKEDSPLHYCCRNIVELKNSLAIDEMKSTVHWRMAELLRSFGADYRIPDAEGRSCLDIATECPALKDLLMKSINLDRFPVLIKPWKSVSKSNERYLAKVARHLESEQVESYWYLKDHLARGSFGAVFVGINENDGREVAIKRIEKIRMERPEEKREITSLTALVDSDQVVSYLYYLEDNHFFYIVLELMEGNLDDLLNKSITMKEREELCNDVVKGLSYMHRKGYLHRDLKPGNILFKNVPKLCLKIADFRLSRCYDSTQLSTVYGTNAGTKSWIAPEVLNSTKYQHSPASDMFSCGLVLHYFLSVKKHPFCPKNCADKSEWQICAATETNITNGNKEGWDDSLSSEATNLLEQLLESDVAERPTAAESLAHPLFWSKMKKMDFLIAVGSQPEFECPRAKRTFPLTAVETDLEARFGTTVKYENWNDRGFVKIPSIYTEMTKRRKRYDTRSVVELVRLIRNAHAHVSETTRPTPIRKLLLEDFVFLEYFPNLVTEVYKAVTTHGWDQTREEIKYAMKK